MLGRGPDVIRDYEIPLSHTLRPQHTNEMPNRGKQIHQGHVTKPNYSVFLLQSDKYRKQQNTNCESKAVDLNQPSFS
jgi:hypothetical protein